MTVGNLNTRRTWSAIVADLRTEFRRWGISEYQVPAYRDAKRDGAVVVRFARRGQWQEVTCGRWTRSAGNPEERNLLAIVLALEAVRLAEQRGILGLMADVAKRLALPEPSAEMDPHAVLGVARNAPPEVLVAAYRARLKTTHPDHGGTREKLSRVVEAGKALGLDRATA